MVFSSLCFVFFCVFPLIYCMFFGVFFILHCSLFLIPNSIKFSSAPFYSALLFPFCAVLFFSALYQFISFQPLLFYSLMCAFFWIICVYSPYLLCVLFYLFPCSIRFSHSQLCSLLPDCFNMKPSPTASWTCWCNRSSSSSSLFRYLSPLWSRSEEEA